jgi:hypothetical protein
MASIFVISAVKTAPHINAGKGATLVLLPGNSSTTRNRGKFVTSL